MSFCVTISYAILCRQKYCDRDRCSLNRTGSINHCKMHLDRFLCALLCLLVVLSGREATLSKKDKKGKKKKEQVDPQDPFIGLCQISMPTVP